MRTLVSVTSTTTHAIDAALGVLQGRRVATLTGAGMSTDSGIPDYRGPGSVSRSPMTYQEFISGSPAQQRYWARSHVGWGRMSAASPNAGHRAVAALQASGVIHGLITQNVDGLHSVASLELGVAAPIDLHGRIDRVICLRCGHLSARADLHDRLSRLNPGYADRDAVMAPDGDAVIEDVSGFQLAACLLCGGVLKPDVVFFGESVPKPRVQECFGLVAGSGALLVAGSSLHVMSGLRFVRAAAKAGTPVVIINRGSTRGDPLATVKIEAGCSEILAELALELN